MAQPPAPPNGGGQQQQLLDGRGPVAPGRLFKDGFSWEHLRPCDKRAPRRYSSIVSATAGRISRALFDSSLDGRRRKVIQNSNMRVVVPGVDQWSFEALVNKYLNRQHPVRPGRNKAEESERHDWALHKFGFWKATDTHLSAVFHQLWYGPP